MGFQQAANHSAMEKFMVMVLNLVLLFFFLEGICERALAKQQNKKNYTRKGGYILQW